VTQDERGSWLIGGVKMDVRPTVRSVYFEHRHAVIAILRDATERDR